VSGAIRRKPGRKTPWRDNIEAVAVAVIMALVLKYFVVEAYKIPTGSMQPALMGSAQADVFDRILVDKLSYHFRDPERWEVVVFTYPLDRSKNFVKRLVGMPDEDFRVALGDLWRRDAGSPVDAPWQILRRPRNVQADVWKRLDLDEPETSFWRQSSGDGWRFDGRSIEARSPGEARFRPEAGAILDRYTDGYPDGLLDKLAGAHPGSNENPVGDLRLAANAEVDAACTSVDIVLDEGLRQYVFRFPGPAAAEDARPSITVREAATPGVELARAEGDPWKLAAGEELAVAAQNMDDLLELEIDGAVACALEIESATDQRSGIRVAFQGAGGTLSELMPYRDIYYTSAQAKVSETTIPPGSYFMMGDNTQDSSDSRDWTFARYALLGSESQVLRGNWRRGENPIETHDPAGTTVWLRDEWGERHQLRPGSARLIAPEQAPFVPRSLVRGRALAVFWPFLPTRGVYRLQWVH
jgi:signal peptidase I